MQLQTKISAVSGLTLLNTAMAGVGIGTGDAVVAGLALIGAGGGAFYLADECSLERVDAGELAQELKEGPVIVDMETNSDGEVEMEVDQLWTSSQ